MPYKNSGKPKAKVGMKGFSQKHVMTMDKLMKQGHSFPEAGSKLSPDARESPEPLEKEKKRIGVR